ncbi:HNH endonuclease [Enterococcus sp. LJL120]
MIHRLVAETFLPNPDNLPVVNHIDGNKGNPKLTNLEWVTFSDNAIHAFETGLHVISDKHRNADSKIGAINGAKTTSKKVSQFDKDGNFVKTYPSVREAERITGARRQNIIKVCKTKKGTSLGYIWRYAE